MKTICFALVLFAFAFGNAQDAQLFEYEWKLEKIVTESDTFTATPYPDPESEILDQLFFSEYNGIYEFIFGYYGNAMGYDLVFDDDNSSFEITEFGSHFGGSSPAETYFRNEFIYIDNTQSDLHNPFQYSFRFEGNFIYLDITNNVGTVATFFDNTMSQDSFEKNDIDLYPNPTTDNLFIEHQHFDIDKLTIFDQQGRIVLHKESLIDNSLDVSALQKGLYVLKVQTKNGSIQKRFLKK